MDAYITKNLQPGEKLLHMARPHWIVFAPAFLSVLVPALLCYVMAAVMKTPVSTFAVVMLLALGLGIWNFLKAGVYFLTTELGITDRRIIGKLGLLSRYVVEIDLDRIDTVQIEQPFLLGMMLNYGTVTIRGFSGTPIPIHNIRDPLAFRNARSTQQTP